MPSQPSWKGLSLLQYSGLLLTNGSHYRYDKRKCKLFIVGVSYGAKIAALVADVSSTAAVAHLLTLNPPPQALPSTLQLSGVALLSGWVIFTHYSFSNYSLLAQVDPISGQLVHGYML